VHRSTSLALSALIGAVLVVGAAVGGPADAAGKAPPVVGADFRISGNLAITADQSPAVAWSQTNNTGLVVWHDWRNAGTHLTDIYGRRVSADGKPIGGDFRISSTAATGYDMNPAVAWDSAANEYLVVWDDGRNHGSRGSDIYGRRVSAFGRVLGKDFRVSGRNALQNDSQPAVAWNATAAEYFVVWVDARSFATRAHDIYGRRVASAGLPIADDARISPLSATSNEIFPAVAWNQATNQYLVVWEDWRNQPTRGFDIYGRRAGADGQPLGSARRISGRNATADDRDPALAWSAASNEFLVAWADGRDAGTRGIDVYARRVGANGKPIAGDRRIVGTKATQDDGYPAVAWNPATGKYLVTWSDGRNSPARSADIYARRIGANGRPSGRDFRVCGPAATASDDRPAVAYSSTSDQFLVVWQDARDIFTRGWDIRGRRLLG